MTLIASIALLVLGLQAQPAPSQSALRILVVQGEDAVNIIQQKTAVAPVVEIRDRNNLPVAGATVTFTIGGQGASFGGLSTLTVTTNAAGQAAAVGVTPTAAGAIQINASALVQGQALTATITQTNVLTAAQAVGAAGATGGAGGGAGGGGAATSGAAAGGGGISGTTIGIVGGAVAAVGGGALIATQVVGGGAREFAGNFSMEMTLVFGTCSRLERYTGRLAIEFEDWDKDPLNGTATIENGRVDYVTGTPGCTTGPQPGQTGPWGVPPTPASGPGSNITFTVSETVNGAVNTMTFQGVKNGDSINGTMRYTFRFDGPFGVVTGTTSATVTLIPN